MSSAPCRLLLGSLTLADVKGPFDHLLKQLRFRLPATSPKITAMGFGQELKRLQDRSPVTASLWPKLCCFCGSHKRRRRESRDLFIVLGVAAAAVAVETSVQPPDVSIAAVAAADPPQELLESGPHRPCLLTVAVGQVFSYSSHKNLENLKKQRQSRNR